MIRSAPLAHQQRKNPFSGLENTTPIIDRKLLVSQQQSRVDELRAEKYENILANNDALTLVKGTASFKDTKTLRH